MGRKGKYDEVNLISTDESHFRVYNLGELLIFKRLNLILSFLVIIVVFITFFFANNYKKKKEIELVSSTRSDPIPALFTHRHLTLSSLAHTLKVSLSSHLLFPAPPRMTWSPLLVRATVVLPIHSLFF